MKRRSESFFGLHFDFHATPDRALSPVGSTLKEEDIRRICREVRPDFIQIDCKGHPGWASYPTACGNAMPVFDGDPLMLWRKVTAEEGVALYMHYSGVWDAKYCASHPEETVTRADGTKSEYATRTNGKYVDELLIPQLKELATKYGVNGIWVDGDCWGTEADFSPETVAAFEKETGIDLCGKLPANRGDQYYDEYREYCRELFRRYVRKYTDAVHEVAPRFQVASNWAFTDHMPEKISANVDFISGDLNPWQSFDSARYAGRAIAQQNFTWDLMSWNFRAQDEVIPGHTPKHPAQIMQEAAAVISVGGGFQNYITQYPEGAPKMDEIMRMKDLSEFMRCRENYCFRGRARHQAAIVLSTYDRLKESWSLYTRNGCEKIMGLLSIFADAGQSVELVSEHVLKGNCADYPLIAVPETFDGLEEETVTELLAYAQKGGNLFISGNNTCRLFEKASRAFSVSELGNGIFTCNGIDFGAVANALEIKAENAETVCGFCKTMRDERRPFGVIVPYGKGKLCIVGANIGQGYNDSAQYTYRTLVETLAEKLYTPVVKRENALGALEITALDKDGKLMIQLVNANCNHGGKAHATWDMIPPVCNVRISVAAEEGTKFILRPEGKVLTPEFKDGRAYLDVGTVEIHSIVEVIKE
ncbi:MAG: alpha-L-fucosidase [Clostridia bacterium]|nr:alpha-L-fucosidase [Clostridia bacterium]